MNAVEIEEAVSELAEQDFDAAGFTQMKSDLQSEQRSMRDIWKKREKQIDKVLLNTTDMYGSIKGIAGNVLG